MDLSQKVFVMDVQQQLNQILEELLETVFTNN